MAHTLPGAAHKAQGSRQCSHATHMCTWCPLGHHGNDRSKGAKHMKNMAEAHRGHGREGRPQTRATLG